MQKLELRRPKVEQLAAARALSAFLREQLARVGEKPADDLLCLKLAIISRAATTLDALLVLVENGYSEQAMMLARPIFEALVDAHWVRVKPDDAIAELAAHRESTNNFMAGNSGAESDGSPDRRAALLAAKKHWSGAGALHPRMKAIEQHYAETGRRFPEEIPGTLRSFDNEHNLWANWLLHGSFAAFDFTVSPPREGLGSLARVGRTDEYTVEALYKAAWLGAKLAWLAVDQAPPDNPMEIPELVETEVSLFGECLRTLTPATLAELLTVGDLDPCPCGSGRHAADCHKDAAVRRHLKAMDEALSKLTEHYASSEPDPMRDGAAMLRVQQEFMAGFEDRESLGKQRASRASKRNRGKRRK